MQTYICTLIRLFLNSGNKMAKIVLAHPYFEGRFSGMPMGMVYIATSLANAGHETGIIDINAKNLTDDEFKSRIAAERPDYVGFASTSPTHLDACHLARLVKEVGDIPVIKGGTHETYCFATTLEYHGEIDFSVIGNGEFTIVELIERLDKEKSVDGVQGIAFRNKGAVKFTSEKTLEKNLDNYPHPDRTLIEPSKFYNFNIFNGEKTTQASMSRGCSYDCNFCPVDRPFSFHSADYVLEELRQIQHQGYKAVFWDDAIFTARKNLVQKILDGVIAEGLEFQMGAQTRADVNIAPKMLELMKKAGFVYISFGMESGDEAILAGYNKRLKVSDVETAVQLSKSHGLQTSVTAIVGAPDETLDSLARTIDAINRIRPDAVSWSAYSIYPGSKLANFDPLWYEDHDLPRGDLWNKFDEGRQSKHVKDIEFFGRALEMIESRTNPDIKL